MEAAPRSVQEHDHYTAILRALHPVLPRNTQAYYLAEGAANVVYILHVPDFTVNDSVGPFSSNCYYLRDPATGDSVFNGKLLRLRKDRPYTAPYHIAQADFLKYIAPHFNKEDLVSQSLVHLRPSGLVPQLNKELQQWEMGEKIPYPCTESCRYLNRPKERQGIYLADDEFGLLVADQRPEIGVKFMEFKPKWLTQSPAAPRYSKRCRTCAKRAYSNAQRARSGELPIQGFCPLNLVSGDDKLIARALKSIFGFEIHLSPSASIKLDRLCQWAKHSPLLAHLRNIHQQLDREGVFAADPHGKNFLTAMTLRDCSVYLHVPDDELQPITAKLGDLDLKRPDKVGYWRNLEAALLAGGWYMGTEREQDRQPLDCYLFPEYWTELDQRPSLRPVQ